MEKPLLTPLQASSPANKNIKPDLYFVGFEITAALAKGSSTPSATNPGWFICFEERAGEIVFGADEFMEIRNPLTLRNWDSLEWGHILSTNIQKGFVDSNRIITTINPQNISNPDNIIWGSNSSDMAYSLYQKPSRVFIHSNDMLI
jgi:hypothetical protein